MHITCLFQFYNAEEDAIGFYKQPEKIPMTALITYFDFGGFVDGDTFHGLSIKSESLSYKTNVAISIFQCFSLNPPVKYFTDRSKAVLLLWIFYVFSVLCLLCLCARLFICALWSPAGKGLTSWLS